MFIGQFEHSLDDKNRLMIPAKMREQLGIKVYLMNGFDGCISIYTAGEFEKLVRKLSSLPFNQKSSRDYIRNILGSASELSIDSVGRIAIPNQLKDKYHIEKETVILGVGDHIEVFNKSLFQKYETELNANFEKIAESIHFNEN